MCESHSAVNNLHFQCLQGFYSPLPTINLLEISASLFKLEFDEEKTLIWEKVHTLDMQYYCMDNISKTNYKVNRNQKPDDIGDQKFGNLKYFKTADWKKS